MLCCFFPAGFSWLRCLTEEEDVVYLGDVPTSTTIEQIEAFVKDKVQASRPGEKNVPLGSRIGSSPDRGRQGFYRWRHRSRYFLEEHCHATRVLLFRHLHFLVHLGPLC